ncbi:MAG: RdgB/HAM1 family non-canonical purine NTP pyrophosphatase [Micrococcaceae bacterium]
MAKLLLATHNKGKITEFRQMLAGTIPNLNPEVDVISAADVGAPEPVEDGITFKENALIKARAIAKYSGLPVIADDSGLEVDVLNGMPGIFSARWSGEHAGGPEHVKLLLRQISDVKDEYRSAQFHCCAVLVTPEGKEYIEHGLMKGEIIRESRGTEGFGYDPIFIPDGYDKTNAELTAEEKNEISHRGKALKAILPKVHEVLESHK